MIKQISKLIQIQFIHQSINNIKVIFLFYKKYFKIILKKK